MGDSTAMTIEFLRARLLSERSISRAAKERADQLAKWVMELEEQLRIVTIQRKKAEKAAEEVLAILEAQGIADFSEETDSSSDQDEVPGGLKGSDDTFKEDETSTASKMEKSEIEDALSGSELEVSPSQIGSISWKGRSSSPDSHEKWKAKQISPRQRWCSFMSTGGSSPKYHLGKSCRKIKRKETGSAAGDDKDKHILSDTHEKTAVTWSYISHDQPHSRNEIKKMSPDSSIPFVLNDKNEDTDAIGSGRGEEMERALEQQAQLIDQYQAEENAQTEWERKYSENKYATVGFCESGNQLHVTGHNVEPDEDIDHVDEKPYYNEEAKPRVENASNIKEPKAEISSKVPILQISHCTNSEKTCGSQEATTAVFSDGFVKTDLIRAPCGSNSHVCRDYFLGQRCDEAAMGKIAGPSKGRTFTGAREKQNQEGKYDNSNSGTSSKPNLLPPGGHEIHVVPSSGSPSTANSSGKITKWGSSDLQNSSDMQLSLARNCNLGGVFEGLQRAKALIQQQLSKSPLSSQGTLVSAVPTDSNSWGNVTVDAVKIPIGSAGLFRLPTDSYPHARLAGHEINGSRSRLAAASPFGRLASSTDGYWHASTSHREARTGVSMNNQSFDPYHLVTGLPASNVLGLPYADAKTGMPVDYRTTEKQTLPNRISVTQTDVRCGMPPDYQSPQGGQPLPNEISKLRAHARIRMPPEDQYLMCGPDITRCNLQTL